MEKQFADFMARVHTGNKEFVLEKWDEWQTFTAETLKADVEEQYPDGFKSFLVEKLDEEIKKHTPAKKKKAKK